jgi:hypothetical protein
MYPVAAAGAFGAKRGTQAATLGPVVRPNSTGVTVDFRRVEYDIEAAAQGILASELPHEFASQIREARGFKACASARRGC